jgi:hypothetical protein
MNSGDEVTLALPVYLLAMVELLAAQLIPVWATAGGGEEVLLVLV